MLDTLTPVPAVALGHVRSLYGEGVWDEVWVPKIAKEGWIVISADRGKKGGFAGRDGGMAEIPVCSDQMATESVNAGGQQRAAICIGSLVDGEPRNQEPGFNRVLKAVLRAFVNASIADFCWCYDVVHISHGMDVRSNVEQLADIEDVFDHLLGVIITVGLANRQRCEGREFVGKKIVHGRYSYGNRVIQIKEGCGNRDAFNVGIEHILLKHVENHIRLRTLIRIQGVVVEVPVASSGRVIVSPLVFLKAGEGRANAAA